MTFSDALYAFWSGFTDDGAPMEAYLTGHVPDDALFPCVSFANVQGAAFGRVPATAFVWIKHSAGVNVKEKRDAFFGQVRRAIPESGRVLRYDGGMCVLYRNKNDFLSDYNPPGETNFTDAPIRGGRVSYELVFYSE